MALSIVDERYTKNPLWAGLRQKEQAVDDALSTANLRSAQRRAEGLFFEKHYDEVVRLLGPLEARLDENGKRSLALARRYIEKRMN